MEGTKRTLRGVLEGGFGRGFGEVGGGLRVAEAPWLVEVCRIMYDFDVWGSSTQFLLLADLTIEYPISLR